MWREHTKDVCSGKTRRVIDDSRRGWMLFTPEGDFVSHQNMLGGLYGDLPEAKSNNAKSSTDSGRWAQKPAFAPPIRKHIVPSGPKSVTANARRPLKPQDGKFPRPLFAMMQVQVERPLVAVLQRLTEASSALTRSSE